ncbi:hypothetical protein K7957_11085 [Sphingomonas yunnanensis]|uniref:hypothetical protein n=1 Tax=Sphingomonas yunnanensis TaxID=310400 RepID=UPI001CA75B7F|nr:hypothetical protein [Sphingomonas yunnanensis]MBY9063474.1 hypothetical protein [Sphingomonas yunnanensis]
MKVALALALLWLGTGAAAAAQQSTPSTATTADDSSPSRLATSSAGTTGQRQSREITAKEVGIEPMARIDDRIANRVESRIRNRLDRFYDPQANALSPFKDAGEKARTAARKLRR